MFFRYFLYYFFILWIDFLVFFEKFANSLIFGFKKISHYKNENKIDY